MNAKRILLVEDDEFLHQLYVDLLTSDGYAVTGIKNGDDAYREIGKNTWDLVLLDVILPGMDGFEIMDRIKHEGIAVSCPIIYLSNLDGSESDKKKLGEATDHWIKSSLAPPQFLDKVHAVLDSK